MADEEDLTALRNGDTDLVRRDFRNAVFDGQFIGARDFSNARLEGARFSDCNLAGSTFERANLTHSIFRGVQLASTKWRGSVFGADFTNSDLRDSVFERCVFHECKFKGADLRGASFQHSTIQENTLFDEAIVDETTRFDGAHVLRSAARHTAFRFYEVHRGSLRRKAEVDVLSSPSHSEPRTELIARIESLQAELERLMPATTLDKAVPGLGHNNPPEATPVSPSERATLIRALDDLKAEAAASQPNAATVADATSSIGAVASKIARWVASHADTAADEFAKGLGRNLSDPLRLAAAWTLFAGGLSAIGHIARTAFGF